MLNDTVSAVSSAATCRVAVTVTTVVVAVVTRFIVLMSRVTAASDDFCAVKVAVVRSDAFTAAFAGFGVIAYFVALNYTVSAAASFNNF